MPPHGCVPRAAGARVASPGREFTGNRIAPAEVGLIRCLAFERGVGDPLVVLGHVERDEPLDGRDVVERVQEQPSMLERAPPGFDERVGEAHVDLSDDALQSAAIEERVHVAVEVLHARVHEHVGLRRCRKVTGRPREHVVRVHRIEAPRDRPREDSPGEVVDHGVNVRLGAVEQLEDRDVNVPGLVRSTGAKSDLRLGRIQTQTRATPASLADQPAPGARMREDLADALGVEREPTNGHVAVLGGLDHVADRFDLAVRQPLRLGARTAGSIVERADLIGLHPRVVSGRRHSENSERRQQRHASPGTLDRAKQASLGGGVGNSREFELEARDAQQREQEPQDRGHPRGARGDGSADVGSPEGGISVQGYTLYSTAFPCHECARHIVASGIAEVRLSAQVGSRHNWHRRVLILRGKWPFR
jgi:hypothetical protein